MAGGALAICSVIGSGLLADRFGQRWVLWVSTGLITLLCPTIYWLDTHPVVYILIGFLLLGFAHGQASAIVPDRFPPEYRDQVHPETYELARCRGRCSVHGLGPEYTFVRYVLVRRVD